MNESTTGIHSNVGLHAEVPLVEYIRHPELARSKSAHMASLAGGLIWQLQKDQAKGSSEVVQYTDLPVK